MQTFLPYPSFRASVRVLDDRRLGKQRVETYQILRSLLFARYAWKNHPAVRMWRGFVPALVSYGVAACEAWTDRGYHDSVRQSLLAFTGGHAPDQRRLQLEGHLPPWLGDRMLHRSHQSALLRKSPESYRPAFGRVTQNLNYYWPADCFPRWPFRRPHANPLAADGALLAAGFDAFRPGQREVTDAIENGHDVLCCMPARAGATCTGLMAAMTRPAVALWIWPGRSPSLIDEITETRSVSTPGAVTANRTSRPQAPSTARPPTEEDTAEVEAEISAEREHIFRHPDELTDAAPAAPGGAGLIVIERAHELSPAERDQVVRARSQFPAAPLLALTTALGTRAQRRLMRQLAGEGAVFVESG